MQSLYQLRRINPAIQCKCSRRDQTAIESAVVVTNNRVYFIAPHRSFVWQKIEECSSGGILRDWLQSCTRKEYS
jgi:hypothetical protein